MSGLPTLSELDLPEYLVSWWHLIDFLQNIGKFEVEMLAELIHSKYLDRFNVIFELIFEISFLRPHHVNNYAQLFLLLHRLHPNEAPTFLSSDRFLLLNMRLAQNGISAKLRKDSLFFSELISGSISLLDTPDIAFPRAFDKFRHDKFQWSRLIADIRAWGYLKDGIEYALKYDEFDVLRDLTTHVDFSFAETLSLSPYECANEEPISLLSFSAFYGSMKCFKFLLLNDLEMNEEVADFAVCSGNYEITRICEQRNCTFATAFKKSIEYLHNEIADWISITFDIYEPIPDLPHLLNIPFVVRQPEAHFIALKTPIAEVIMFLCDKGFSVDTQNPGGFAQIHVAAANGYSDIAALLVSYSCDVHKTNEVQNTALHLACEGGHAAIATLLISSGADVSAVGQDGQTPLHLASREGHTAIIKLLLERNPDKSLMNADPMKNNHLQTTLIFTYLSMNRINLWFRAALRKECLNVTFARC
jgi:hypothetical protein